MGGNPIAAGATSHIVRCNIRRIRAQQQFTLGDLSARLADAGRPMLVTVLSKIERGERRNRRRRPHHHCRSPQCCPGVSPGAPDRLCHMPRHPTTRLHLPVMRKGVHHPVTDRTPLNKITPEQLSALYDERDQLRALIDRGWDQHMSFTLIRPDGTDEQLPCADWCYACLLDRLEAERDGLREELKGARATIDHMAKAMSWISGHDRQGLDHLDEAQYEARAREAAVKQARHWAARARGAEATVARGLELNRRWAQAGPPPIGTSLARWWDARLVEQHNALFPPTNETKEK